MWLGVIAPADPVLRPLPYCDVLAPIVESVTRLGPEYQARMWRGFRERWIDVYENEGKRSGAYSAPVYGVHPYMLMNWNDTLDDVFTLAHEMGHSMHTMLSHERQLFVYSDYTIFVAEVPSTLSEELGPINAANLKKAHALLESGRARGKLVLSGFA